jgi:hypothetical protein
MNVREPAGSEEVRFEDLDLVYIIPFDLGASIEAWDLGAKFSAGSKLFEAIWSPSSGLEIVDKLSRAYAMFALTTIPCDRAVLNLNYLKLDRYVRLILSDLDLDVEDPELKIKDLKCELHLFLHNAGVGIVTAWIHLNGDLSADDVIKIERKLYREAGCIVKDPSGNIEKGTLKGFIDRHIIVPLQAVVVFKNKYEDYENYSEEAFNALTGKLAKKLRLPYEWYRTVICIRNHKCCDGCRISEDGVKRH